MKKIFIYITIFSGAFYSCVDLDIAPKQEKAVEFFYTNEKELRVAANAFYQHSWIKMDDPSWSDDIFHRSGNGINAITGGTINGETNFVGDYWRELYQGIEAANIMLEKMVDAKVSDDVFTKINAEARFFRAYYYSVLIAHYGDVPFITKPLSLWESSNVTRTSASDIKGFIYSELDYAASKLPKSNSTAELQTVTAGAALGIKARTALYFGDYVIARDAAKAVMDLDIYSLYPDYGELFLTKNQLNDEFIFSISRSILYGGSQGENYVRPLLSRNAGGWASEGPSWSMLCAYECTDGQTIDKSSMYDPHDPFKDRDPRMAYSVLEHWTPWLGIPFQPHPEGVRFQ